MVRRALKILLQDFDHFCTLYNKGWKHSSASFFSLRETGYKICYTFFKPYIFCYIENRNELVTATANLRNFVERLFYEFREGFKTKVTVVFILGLQQNFI